MALYFQNKYSSFSWTEDETQSLYKEVRFIVCIPFLVGHQCCKCLFSESRCFWHETELAV